MNTKLEINKSYDIRNKNRWGAVEVAVFSHETKKGVNVQSEYKSADARVTPQTQEELDLLHDSIENDAELLLSEIALNNMLANSEGTDYFVYHTGWSVKEKDDFESQFDSGDWFDRVEFLEDEHGYDYDYAEVYFDGIEAEEFFDNDLNGV